jgi:hypothetical protein
MFAYAFVFNQPVNHFKMNLVTDMTYMFKAAYRFNQPVNLWNTSVSNSYEGMF